jgi:ABC-2 type transport system permease protein
MISRRATQAVTRRILIQLFRDPRSRVVLVVTPGLLLVIVRYLFDSAIGFSTTGVMMIGLFPTISMFLLGSTTLVRERNQGTLEAVLVTPASKMDIVAGYICAAAIASLAQAIVTVTVAYTVSGLSTASPPWLVGFLTMLSGIFGMSLGLVVSALVKNEGQAFQFIPGVLIPQLLISGILWPVSEMAGWVQRLESVLPLSAVTQTMNAARAYDFGGVSMLLNVAEMLGITILALMCATWAIPRRTA